MVKDLVTFWFFKRDAEAHSEISQTYRMERKAMNYFRKKSSILDFLLFSEYASEVYLKAHNPVEKVRNIFVI